MDNLRVFAKEIRFAENPIILLALVFALFSLSGCGKTSTSTTTTSTTTTTLYASSASIPKGALLRLTAFIAPSAASGTVTFYDGSTSLGIGTISSGMAILTISSLGIGTHAITATYDGSSTDTSSTSSIITVTVTSSVATTTALSVSSSSIVFGTSLTLRAVVSPPNATGAVTFYDGSTVMGTGTLSSGKATLTTSYLSGGTHIIKAGYGGSSTYGSSTSSSVTVIVSSSSGIATTTALSASSTSIVFGASLTLTAAVSPSAASGTVTFYAGSVSLGTGMLHSGTATLTNTSLSVDTHIISAVYDGSSTYSSSTSNAITVAVVSTLDATATTTTLIASSSTVVSGAGVKLLALLSPMIATGTVTFYDGSLALGTADINSGSALLSTSSFSVGSHTLTAVYGGSSSYLSSTSTPVALAVLFSATGSWTSGTIGYGTAAYKLNSGTLYESNLPYNTAVDDQSAIGVTGINSNLLLAMPVITAGGSTSSTDNSSFYGLNAAVLNYNGGNLSILDGKITASGPGGNGVFAYGTGKVSIFDTTIGAMGANGHGLYAAGGGTVVASNVTASSTGASGSIVATDHGGGTITIIGGSYSAAGMRSAGIYSTGTVIAYGGTFSATNAEAVVIEGSNITALNHSTLNAVSSTNEHRGIFLYQSMSGDADNSYCGTGACFIMSGGTFNYTDSYNSSSDATANCSAFAVANQVAHFILTDVTVNNSCPTLLLSALNKNWNYKGGTATLKAFGETLVGNVIVDSVSTADIYLNASSLSVSKLTGQINAANTGNTVDLTLDSTSKWVVTGTSYLTSLSDADSTYSNITCQTSGCKVYVGGKSINVY
jgi:hypothetical protein